MLKKPVTVSAFLWLAAGFHATPVMAQSCRAYTFQCLHPAFLKTEILPTYAPYEPAVSPAAANATKNDFISKFYSPGGKQVVLVVKTPVTKATYNVPAIKPGQTAYDYLNGALYLASGSPRHNTVINIPKNIYNFNFPLNSNCTSSTDHQPKYVHWQLAGGDDLVVDGHGSTVNFSDLCLGLNLANVNRVLFRNFTFAWPNLQIATVATVTGTGGNANAGYTYDVHIDAAHTAKLPNTLVAVTSWDREAGHWDLVNIDTDVSYGNGVALTCTETPAQRKTAGCTVKNIPTSGAPFLKGASVLLRHYDFASAVSATGEDITFDNITLQNIIGTGFVYNQGRGFRVTHSTLERLKGQPISGDGNASIITGGVGGDIVFDHDSFGYQGDDAFDMNTPMVRFTPAQVNNTTPMATYRFNAAKPDQLDWPPYDAVQAGDTIGLSNNALAFQSVATVKSVSTPTNGQPSTVTLDRAIGGTLGKSAFIAADLTSTAGARYLIAWNTFAFNRARALLLQTPYGWVADNRFVGQTLKSVYVLASLYWGEGNGAEELVIARNNFQNSGHRQDFLPLDVMAEAANFPNNEDEIAGTKAATPAINQDIVIAGNQFDSDQVTAAVNLSSVNNAVLSGNRFTLGQKPQPTETYQFPLSIHDASHIYFDNRNSVSAGWLSTASCAQSRLLALSDPPPTVSVFKPVACGVAATTADVVLGGQ